MAWIESHQELRDHPKTEHLALLLGVPKVQVIGHLHCMWWWAVDYARDGYVTKYPAAVIARGALWDGDPEVFINALLEARWLDQDGKLHDWEEYAGRLIEQREKAKERYRKWKAARSKRDANARPTRRQRVASEQLRQDNEVTIPNQPNQTNLTKPDLKSPNGDLSAEPADPSHSEPIDEPGSEEQAKKGPSAADVRRVMDHFNNRFVPEVWARPLAMTKERADKIRTRLRRYSVEQLCEAIDHLRASAWACGENDRGWRATPEYLFRNDTTVDRWLNEPAEAAKRTSEVEDNPFIRGYIEAQRRRRGEA